MKARPIQMNVKEFNVAHRMFEAGRPEADFRKQWTDGTGQKLFALFNCNKRFPQVRLIERMRKGFEIIGKIYYEKDGAIAYEPLDKEPLRHIAKGQHPDHQGAGRLENYIKKCMS